MNKLRVGSALALGGLATLSLAGCFAFGIDSGMPGAPEAAPVDDITSQVNRIGAYLQPISTRGLDGDYLAANVVAPLDDPSWGTTIEVMKWGGNVSDGGAELVVRITPVDPANGDGPECYLYSITDEVVSTEEQECTDAAAPPLPTPAPLPELDAAARALVLSTLETATPDSLAADFESAFPDARFSKDTLALDGELIAAVGLPASEDCVLAVKSADGVVQDWGFDPVSIKPGEIGCATGLYTNPPL